MNPEQYQRLVEKGDTLWEYVPINLEPGNVDFSSNNFPNLGRLFPDAFAAVLREADSFLGKLREQGWTDEALTQRTRFQFTYDDDVSVWDMAFRHERELPIEQRIIYFAVRFRLAGDRDHE